MINDIRIGVRLGIGFGVAVLLLCIPDAFALMQASRLHEGTRQLAQEWLPKVQTLGEVRALSSLVRKTTLEGLLAKYPKDRSLQRIRHDAALTQLDATLAAWKNMATLDEEQRLYVQFNAAWSAYVVLDEKANEVSTPFGNNANDDRGQLAADSAVIFNPVALALDKAIRWERDAATTAGQQADHDFSQALRTTVLVISLSLALCTAIAIVITRSITQPVRRSVKLAQTVAQGDLSSRVEVSGRDEVGQLLQALRDMNERLREVVGRVHVGGETIARVSREVATGNADLSQRTEAQAASLQQTAASMQQLTETVRRNAKDVHEGNALALNASSIAGRAGAIVGDVMDTMRDISSSSSKVAEINTIIEGIAFQTNILALNAAVEAARAGDQGRGFAVVAGEVRTLAQRCATAAREVKELVDLSVTKVDVGSGLVQEAGSTMDEVLRAVTELTALMANIATSLDEQHAGIEQINIAVMQMDQMTQQNATLVEQSAAATQAMAAQSADLHQAVSFFRYTGESAPDAALAEDFMLGVTR